MHYGILYRPLWLNKYIFIRGVFEWSYADPYAPVTWTAIFRLPWQDVPAEHLWVWTYPPGAEGAREAGLIQRALSKGLLSLRHPEDAGGC